MTSVKSLQKPQINVDYPIPKQRHEAQFETINEKNEEDNEEDES